MELLEEQREKWGSRGGFVLAAVGSAVGLGNLWRFPYELYDHGGGAFLIPYIIAVFVVGLPMLILEFSLGHFTQRAAPDAFAHGHRRFEFVGWWSTILGFVIISFYAVVLAYCFSFLWFSFQGILAGGELPWAAEGVEGVKKAEDFFLKTYLGHTSGTTLGPIRWNIFWPLVVTWLVMYLCICRGVKLVGKIVWLTVPLPWLMLLILTVRGLTLPGSMQGLAYYLNPTWSELAKATTWRFAFGQAFFSLSLAFGGVMITYASFLHRKSDLNNNAAIICLADFSTSFVAGLVIFSTLGGMAFVTAQAGRAVGIGEVVRGGAGLAFVVFPYALAQLPYSAWWSFVFFFTLVTLGVDSGFSITESVLAAVVDKTGWKRSVVLPVMSVIGIAAGLVFITKGGLNWLEVVGNFIDGTWGIAFLGLAECIVLGWLWRIDALRVHANERSDWNLGRWWNYAIRIIIPMVLGTLFFWSLFEDFTQEGGFLLDNDGNCIVPNFVGLTVVVAAPVIAVLVSLIKSPLRAGEYAAGAETQNPNLCAGRLGGLLAFFLALVSTTMIAGVVAGAAPAERVRYYLLFESLVLGITAIVISNYVLDKHTGVYASPSWFARWAGIIATLDISAFLAIILINITQKTQISETTWHADKLSGVSYVILSIVFFLIIGGLGWCFWRAIMATSRITTRHSTTGQ
jgi:NSS family neurotransmitter:Na+ symporter